MCLLAVKFVIIGEEAKAEYINSFSSMKMAKVAQILLEIREFVAVLSLPSLLSNYHRGRTTQYYIYYTKTDCTYVQKPFIALKKRIKKKT